MEVTADRTEAGNSVSTAAAAPTSGSPVSAAGDTARADAAGEDAAAYSGTLAGRDPVARTITPSPSMRSNPPLGSATARVATRSCTVMVTRSGQDVLTCT